jgi:hypothetical protein
VKNARLDAVSKAKQAYVLAKTTLENRLREQMRAELANLQTQIDIAVRFAVESGETKADVLRALGTKDYNTLKASLERTQGVAEIAGENPLDSVYGLYEFNQKLYARYDNHGPLGISGEANFHVRKMDDGSIWFMSIDPLWKEDFTVKNQVVAALDNKQDGYYYEEALGWVREQL